MRCRWWTNETLFAHSNQLALVSHRLCRNSKLLRAKSRKWSISRRPWNWSILPFGRPYTLVDTCSSTNRWRLVRTSRRIGRPTTTIKRCIAFKASQRRIFVLRNHCQVKRISQWRPERCFCRNSSTRASWHACIPIFHAQARVYVGRRIDWARNRRSGQLRYLLCLSHQHQYELPWSLEHHWLHHQSITWSICRFSSQVQQRQPSVWVTHGSRLRNRQEDPIWRTCSSMADC